MRFVTALEDGVLTVRVTGEIDHHSAPGIREEIDREMERLAPRRIRLDLKETDFMDSSGLGLILGRLRKTRERGIDFVLLNPSPAIRKILALAGMEQKIHIAFD